MKNTTLKDVLSMSVYQHTELGDTWTSQDTICSLTEEVGELSQEVQIHEGKLPYKEPSVDGVVGEAVDVIINVLDTLGRTQLEDQDEEAMDELLSQIDHVMAIKLLKWKDNVNKRKVHLGIMI